MMRTGELLEEVLRGVVRPLSIGHVLIQPGKHDVS